MTLTTDELTELVAKVAMNMVKGDLRDMVARVVEDKVCEIMEKAVGQMREEIAARPADDEWLVGSTAIAAALGVSRNKFYELRKKGYFGDLLDGKPEGDGSLKVRRGDLLAAYDAYQAHKAQKGGAQ